ncbi:serine/threonine-protein kinase [Mycolicibacterium madagascariense]|nr:serine/threonine-protein kinase [Mycolicibacterium madagascariense]MCV7014743.1 protein kinase [Mycolicibacterium madagascariense]
MSTGELLCGRYAVRGVLGRGGMAVVRDGWDGRLGRAVAVKSLHPQLVGDAESRRRFAHEARAAAALSHPNIVAVHDSGEHAGVPFIVMERLPGTTLADLIARGPLPQDRVRAILAEVLAALATAHAAGIVHRDVKPGNILFTASGRVKVADFGIAKTVGTDHTVAGQVLGTVAYLSPDRLLGTPATPSDDVYAVGVVGYEALTGRRPFPQDTLGSLSRAIMTERPPALRGDVDPATAAVIERAMAPRADWRFADAEEMRAALTEPSPAPPRSPTLVMTSVPPRRNRRFALLGAGLLAVIVAAAALISDVSDTPTPSTPTPSTPTPDPFATTVAPSVTPSPLTPTITAITPATPSVANPPRKHGHGHARGGEG